VVVVVVSGVWLWVVVVCAVAGGVCGWWLWVWWLWVMGGGCGFGGCGCGFGGCGCVGGCDLILLSEINNI
jgi:hypothetical protein